MLKPLPPPTEKNRLEILKSYDVLDTLPEKLYDNITLLASQICGTPIALVSLVDDSRQWFKSRVGVDATETPRDVSFCGHAILEKGIFQIADARKDFRFADNPLVTGGPQVIFYAGAPLTTPTGEQVGTLCVIDNKPRTLTAEQTASLELLAEQVVVLLELKKAQKKAIETHREFEKSEAELLRARDFAEHANQTKSSFLANMSHEIRTPLGAIIGFSEMLRDENVDRDERRSFVEVINRNAKSLTRVIDDILDLSKVEAGRLDIELSSMSLREVLRDVVALFADRAKSVGLDLNLSIPSTLPERIESDAARIRQILVNIVGNAIKFTESGAVSISVEFARVAGITHAYEIAVTDTGRGLSDDERLKLFQPFSQADNTTTREYGGTGLGLVLSRRLAKALGGNVEIAHSELGKGSTFSITFSAHTSESKQADPIFFVKKAAGAKPLDRLRILLVEDSPDNQVLIKRVLTRNGAAVTLADNGLIAVNRALEDKFDIVLMDIQMPVMDGYTAMAKLKALGYQTPVVALTAHAMEEERLRTRDAGFAAHVTKPIEFSVLIETIEQTVVGSHHREPEPK